MKTSIQPDNEIVDAHMAWAIRLIGQVQLEEDCGEILDQLLAISELLTRTEDMAAELPDGIPASFLQGHRQCLEALQQATNKLIGVLETRVAEHDLDVRARTFSAFLEQNWESWHAEVAPETIEALSRKIFHGAA